MYNECACVRWLSARGCLKSTGARCNHVHRGRRAVLVELKSKQTQRTRVAGPHPSTRIREVDVSIKYCNIIIYKGALSRETLHCNTTRPRSTCSVQTQTRTPIHIFTRVRGQFLIFSQLLLFFIRFCTTWGYKLLDYNFPEEVKSFIFVLFLHNIIIRFGDVSPCARRSYMYNSVNNNIIYCT